MWKSNGPRERVVRPPAGVAASTETYVRAKSQDRAPQWGVFVAAGEGFVAGDLVGCYSGAVVTHETQQKLCKKKIL